MCWHKRKVKAIKKPCEKDKEEKKIEYRRSVSIVKNISVSTS